MHSSGGSPPNPAIWRPCPQVLPGTDGETSTQGLDNLAQRCEAYYKQGAGRRARMGASVEKWRVVVVVGWGASGRATLARCRADCHSACACMGCEGWDAGRLTFAPLGIASPLPAGARFAKWRAVLKISEGKGPSTQASPRRPSRSGSASPGGQGACYAAVAAVSTSPAMKTNKPPTAWLAGHPGERPRPGALCPDCAGAPACLFQSHVL